MSCDCFNTVRFEMGDDFTSPLDKAEWKREVLDCPALRGTSHSIVCDELRYTSHSGEERRVLYVTIKNKGEDKNGYL